MRQAMQQQITVTDTYTGASVTYDYSRANWAKQWACMRGGAVVMWAPPEVSPYRDVVTSGKRWSLVRGGR